MDTAIKAYIVSIRGDYPTWEVDSRLETWNAQSGLHVKADGEIGNANKSITSTRWQLADLLWTSLMFLLLARHYR